MKICILQLNFRVGDFEGNSRKIVEGYRKGVEQGAELVVTTELALFGYPPGDLLLDTYYIEQQDAHLQKVAEQIGGVGLILGAATKTDTTVGLPLYNSALLIQNRVVEVVHHKILLPNYDVFDEKRYFAGAERKPRLFRYNGYTLGLLICEDIWSDVETVAGRKMYGINPVEELGQEPVDALITINASPFYVGKTEIRRKLGESIARRLGCPLVYANQVGGNDELIFDGQSFVVDARGRVISCAAGFREDSLMVDLNSLGNQSGDNEEMRDLHDALIMGTRDYIVKSVGTPKALVALSGGIDSAVTAYIAREALGPENVFGYGMPSDFSSKGSVEDARKLAENLGIAFTLIPIGRAYETLGEVLEPTIGWGIPDKENIDVTEENVQARIRGTIMMAISNRQRGIVLSTGNKSEVSVGYCTLYGDMVGGFAVLSDVYKTKVYELAHYINREVEHIPWSTIEKPPSAELSPGQMDQDSLPPYELLDRILEAYIEGDEEGNRSSGGTMDQETVDWIIKKVKTNEYKRRQMAPGLKVTRKAFGSGRRIPIAAKL